MNTIKIDLEKLSKPNWTEAERANVKLIGEFIQTLMNDHDFDQAIEKFDNPHYTQHNRGIPDGFRALVKYVSNFAKQFPEYCYDVKHIYADGDFVIFHSQITTKSSHRGDDKQGINVMDTWKVKNGQVVEHWDSLQPMSLFMRFY